MRLGFDNDKYLNMQSEHIRRRIDEFGGKLYLELGGKLFDDYHASRVLPGFRPDSKLQMLLQLADKAEVVIVIAASDIERNKVRSDLGITYDQDVMRLIDSFRSVGLYVGSVVLTMFDQAHEESVKFKKYLESCGIPVYLHYTISGYPSNVEKIVSDEGYGKNEYIQTLRELVIVTAPGPGSGKMATCLSQLYHEHRRGIRAGYAKFETFPIWNLPLKHAVNLAYEAATTDLDDVNMIDPYHLEAYGSTAVNYNRDVEIFPVLEAIFTKIYGYCPYKSPTDMGVNMAGNCIFDDDAVTDAASQEIIRRYYTALVSEAKGKVSQDIVYKQELIMKKAGLTSADRPVVASALNKAQETDAPAAAIMLHDGRIITGKTTDLLGSCSSMLLNSLKVLAQIPDCIDLLSESVIRPIHQLKTKYLGSKNPRLHMDEVLHALAICASTSDTARLAMDQLDKLRDCEAHSTVILSHADNSMFKKLGIHLTCEGKYQNDSLFHL